MKLSEIISGTQTVELIEPRDSDSRYLSSLRLLLRDNATGRLTELTIEADMLTMPDEAMLVWSAMEVDERVEDLAAWWAKGDEASTEDCLLCSHTGMIDGDGVCWFPMPISNDEAEPCGCRCAGVVVNEYLPATWTITPDGQEVELQGGGEGGLF